MSMLLLLLLPFMLMPAAERRHTAAFLAFDFV